jgi:hypothetical protein
MVWRNYSAVGQDLAHVVEHDHAVAQQAPSLLGVKGDGVRGVAVRAVSRGARGLVWTHCAPLVWGCGCTWSCEAAAALRAGSAKKVRAGVAVGRHSKVPMPVESFAAGPGTKVPSGSAAGAVLADQAYGQRLV